MNKSSFREGKPKADTDKQENEELESPRVIVSRPFVRKPCERKMSPKFLFPAKENNANSSPTIMEERKYIRKMSSLGAAPDNESMSTKL